MTQIASPTTLAITCLFTFLAFIAFGLRIQVSWMVKKGIGLDAWILSFGQLMILAQLICTIVVAAVAGCAYPKLPPAQMAVFQAKMLFIDPFFNGPAGAAIKISVLLLYKNIFRGTYFHMACNVQIGLILLWVTSFIFGTLFSHDPISGAWSLTNGRERIDFATFALAEFGINIGLDLITLCLPLPVIGKLQMSKRQKIRVICIFWLGLFAVIAASVRLYYAYIEVASAEPVTVRAARTTSVYLWSRIEPCASTIAACLPTYGPLLSRGRSLDDILRSARSFISLRSWTKRRSTDQQSDSDIGTVETLQGTDLESSSLKLAPNVTQIASRGSSTTQSLRQTE